MKRVIDRLILFQQSVEGLIGGQNKFEIYAGFSTGYISNMKKNSGNISSDVILKLKDKFPNLNLDWLINGKGAIFKSEELPTIKERLAYFLEKEKIDVADFCESIGILQAYYIEIKDSISQSKLKKIREKYPELDTKWLMTGEKAMFKYEAQPLNDQFGAINTNYQGSFKDVHTSINNTDEINEISQLKKENILLRKEIEKLKNDLLNEKERLIKVMLKE